MRTLLQRYIPQLNLYLDYTNDKDDFIYPFITNHKLYAKKFTIWLQSHLWLLLLGLLSELVYFYYLLQNFPVTGYYYRLDTMGGIAGFTHSGFLIYLMAFGLLFVLFGFAWWETRRLQDHSTLWIILGFGALFAITTVFVYPVIAIDLFNYIVQSLILVQYHANPLVTPPAQFPKDPLMQLAGSYFNVPSPYGPLGQLIDALPVAIGRRNILASLLLLKFMFSAMLIISAFFIYKILSQIAPRFALPGALALAWNPFALFEFSANGHNDIAMMLLVILAVLALVKEHHVWAMMLLTASALIKFASLPLIPLFFIYSSTHQLTIKKRIIYIIESILALSGLVFIIWGPFWVGPQTLQYLFNITQHRLYSFSIFLSDFSTSRISYDQAKTIGQALFEICFLYPLWLSSKDFLSLLRGCGITMFALLALSATYIQPWYLIWPLVFFILIPRAITSLAVILISYSANLAEIGPAYLFAWHLNSNAFIVVNSCFYFIIFFPPTLLLLVSRFKQIFSFHSSYPYKQ